MGLYRISVYTTA